MDFEDIILEITALIDQGIDYEIIGTTTFGRNIYALHVGSYSGPQIIVEGSIHAREYMAGLCVIDQIVYAVNHGVETGGIYFIPFANPDGVALVLDGLVSVPCTVSREYLSILNNNALDFSRWKANGLGVDLNVNFDAHWAGGAQNVFCPAPANFVGYYPNSEKETRVLIAFTEKVKPIATLSYHAKGEVIYYGFEALTDNEISRDKTIAEYLSSICGYTPIKTEHSTGGYSDFISEHYHTPAFTIEVGPEEFDTPLPLHLRSSISAKNKSLPIDLLEYLINFEGM